MKYLLTFLLLATASSLSAQPIAFEDEFLDNRSGWWVGEGQAGSGRAANGFYTMTSLQRGGWWFTNRPTYIDPTKDYTIEMTVRQKRGAPSSGFGVVFGAAGLQNLNQFLIASSGAARVAAAERDVWADLIPWKRQASVKPKGEFNTLTVERKGNTIRFLVNGEEAGTTGDLRLHGLDIGIMVSDTMELEVDRIVVRQEQKINVVPNAPKSVTKTNLGPNINSEYDEIGPIISHDGRTLWFSVNYHPENEGGTGDADEIWSSTSTDGKTWGKRQRMGRPLNTVQANWVISVTPDNNSLLVANLYNRDGSPGGSGISISRRTATGWSLPERVVIHDFVNHSGWQQFGLSSDRKVLLLSVTGDDTRGDHDLYVSFLLDDGSWSQPRSLGPTINTIGAEASPYLAADGVTLYYSTNGLPGYGLGDIYVSRRLDDTWTNWSPPQNLGPAINTPGNESYFTVPASGTYAYMNSSHKSLGKSDIYRLALPAVLRPQPVVLVHGKVLNSKTRAPLGTEITYRDLASDREIGVASSDPKTGEYAIVLPAGTVYSFMGGLEGYYAVSDNLDVKKLSSYREITRDLLLTPIEVGATIRLNNIFFDFAKSELRSESFPELKRAVEFLRDNPGVVIEVSGHTDDVGTDADNLALSEARARAVVEYLRTEGIPEPRMRAKGFGKSKPVARNTTDEGRQMNRRVEFTIVE
jgi:outer membrane protein OmpA-like peptidoglycan-associated protein